uniref:Uncharacterized protein n=1 Tax=Trichuris muris TaxID=70415 RepID=A0A5S6QZ44_TRIMR
MTTCRTSSCGYAPANEWHARTTVGRFRRELRIYLPPIGPLFPAVLPWANRLRQPLGLVAVPPRPLGKGPLWSARRSTRPSHRSDPSLFAARCASSARQTANISQASALEFRLFAYIAHCLRFQIVALRSTRCDKAIRGAARWKKRARRKRAEKRCRRGTAVKREGRSAHSVRGPSLGR